MPVARRVAIDHPHRVGLVLEASPSTLTGDRGLTEYVEAVVSMLGDRSRIVRWLAASADVAARDHRALKVGLQSFAR